ncbi:MAG: polyprenyl synthetase family protein [Candidatus Competibacteraceae bacterium]|nr:polyprenyl synthetase family protein [Candidatus Competibacteraceae bacterium]
MSALKAIKKPIEKEMEDFERRFRVSMKSSVPLLDKITHYIVKRKGKQVRPMFVFLSAHIAGGVTEATYRAGILIELLHTATLVHDDVVDDSNERRGFFSINGLWKNKIAVLVGDFLLSKGLLLSTENKDFRLLEIVSDAVKLMSEGELMQIEKARRLDIKEDIYFDIIRRKTASLISSCCACGASSAGASEDVVNHMHVFGEKIGIAFQLKDDLFDYENSSLIGKPTGIDIKEQKMTLPLIYALSNATEADKKRIIYIVKNNNNNPEMVDEVIRFVQNSGGILYAEQKMYAYRDEALAMLSDFPDSPYKKSLIDLVIFTTERKY